MNEGEREVWRERLLEHLFGCSEDPEAIERALTSDPELRDLLEETRATADLLKDAVTEEVPGLKLVPPAPVVHRRFWTPLRIAAAALIAVSLGVTSALWATLELRARSARSEALRLVVTGAQSVPDGSPAGLRVETWNFDGAPRPALVRWAAYDGDGTLLESEEAESDGALDLAFAARLAGLRRVEVNASHAGQERSAVFELSPEEANPLAHLSIDKPAYRPGETVWLRALLLRRLSLQPFGGYCNLRIVDPKGAPTYQVTPPLEEGVAALCWTIPDSAAGGMYALELRDAANEFTAEKLEFLVRRYQPPRLAQEITLDRETYAPGERGSAEVAVERVEGGLPVGAAVRGALVIDGEEVWNEEAVLDADGKAIFLFTVPEDVERGDARFAARVTDGGVVETRVEPFVVPVGGVEVAFFPEGGELVEGLASRVYAEVTDVLGRPASAEGRVVDSRGREVARFRTEHQGRGRFEFTPRAGGRYTLEILEPESAPVPLPIAKTRGAVLRALADSTTAGESIELEVVTKDEGPWMMGLYCRGVLVAQDVFRGAGRHQLDLRPLDTVAGVLRATLFDRAMNPVAERLVHRGSGHAIEIEVVPALDETVPGAHQTVELVARDETGSPIACALGVSVTDRAVRDMVGEARLGLADQTWLAADVEELEDLAEFVAKGAESLRNVDLLLGTRGWRRFAWREPEALIEEHGEEAQRLLAREGHSQTPSVIDDRGDMASVVRDARGAAREAREWFASTVVLIALGSFLWLLFRFFWWVLAGALEGRPTLRRTGSGALTVATASLLLVLVLQNLHTQVDMLKRDVGGFGPAARIAGGRDLDVANLVLGDDDLGLEEPQLQAAPAFGRAGEVVYRGPGDAVPVAVGGMPAGPGAPPVDLGLPPPGADMPRLEALLEEELVKLEVEEAKVRFLDAEEARRFWGNHPGGFARVYAHRNQGPPDRPRTDFAETVYWNGLLRTSVAGRARFEFDLSDRVTTWAVNVDAHGSGRVGQGQGSFEAVMPFHLEARLPVELTAGDELLLPVALSSSTAEAPTARVLTELQGPLAFGGDFTAEQSVPLEDGRGRLLVPVSVNQLGGGGRIAFSGIAGGWRDSVIRDLRVVPRGFPKHVTKGGIVTESVELELAIPEDYAPGSLSVELVLYPSRLADILEGLDGILRQPSGCFEQASSSNYPNVLALSYLEAAGANEPAIAARARSLMQPGYDKIAGYECSKRGYEWFGGDPGHEALTAYGLLEFHDMAQVFEVDAEMVGRTREWLLGRRDGQGGYLRNDRALDSFGAAPQPITDAYVTYALVTTGEDPLELKVELETLKKRAIESDDPYEVALAAGALFAAEDWAAADAARDRLKKMQRQDGGLVGTTSSITRSGGTDLAVETTSLAILAWLDDEEDAPYVQRAVEFLAASRRPGGTFGATQATIQALRALTRYARENRRVANPGEARLYCNDYEIERLEIREGQRGAISFEGLAARLEPGVNRIRLELLGGNEFPWALDLSYFADQPANDPDATVSIATRLARPVVEEGATVALEAEVSNLTDDGQPMTLAIIGLPAGLEAPTEVLEDLEEAERFDLWEIRGRELILYWRDLAPGETKSVTLDLIARIPGRTTGPASHAYLYYTPDAKRWAAPLAVEVTPAR